MCRSTPSSKTSSDLTQFLKVNIGLLNTIIMKLTCELRSINDSPNASIKLAIKFSRSYQLMYLFDWMCSGRCAVLLLAQKLVQTLLNFLKVNIVDIYDYQMLPQLAIIL